MAWEDKPTYSQLNTICRWLNYETKFPTSDLQRVDKYLQTHATRGQLRSEMTRLKYLKDNGRLDIDNFFNSELWKEFER